MNSFKKEHNGFMGSLIINEETVSLYLLSGQSSAKPFLRVDYEYIISKCDICSLFT